MSQTTTQTLTDFLLARIAEDEADAQTGRNDAWHIQDPSRGWGDERDQELVGGGKLLARFDQEHGLVAAHHVARWNPARVLAECDAKRRILAGYEHVESFGRSSDSFTIAEIEYVERILPALALSYADHPDYRQVWKP